MHTHTDFHLSAIRLISLGQITPWHQRDLIAFHPNLISCHENTGYFEVLYWSAAGKLEAKHREDGTNGNVR